MLRQSTFSLIKQLHFRVLKPYISPRSFHKTISLPEKPKTYEGEGKTCIHVLNNEADLGLMINGVSQLGFRLNNDVTVLGPMLIFPKSVLSWKVTNALDITEESLALFSVMVPKPDILVIGIGDEIRDTSPYTRLLPIGRKLKMNFEILPTEHACTTFNFLNAENRYVVGAMIPPETLKPTDADIAETKRRYQNIYETDDFLKFN